MSGLLPVFDALTTMLARAPAPPSVEVRPLLAARGAVLARDVVAAIAVPPEDNSAMDGYALRAAEAGLLLPVSQRIAAGGTAAPLAPGTAARIFTGATVPPGADAVAIQENCREVDGCLQVLEPVTPGDNIRVRGQDIADASRVFPAGRRLRAPDLGLLASLGLGEVPVYRPLRVALLSTGSELVEPGSGFLGPGQIYNSNRVTLSAQLQALGLEVVDCGIVADSAEATAAALESAASSADCILSSGGVSVGEEDHVRGQVERLGSLTLWRLAIKPGKPLAFGEVRGVPFIGLPGNPTSSYVTFCLLARPFLLRAQGAVDVEPIRLPARANFSRPRPGNRQEYLRVTLTVGADGLLATPFANQSSGVLSSVCNSNALAVVPVGATVSNGDWLDVLLLETLE
ncbi:molybdopterin molybdotransferase MoeA [Haliea sp. E1-2-M8]|uniref:molybdopterin molybdotransferase MoeA n=1 Tax=Haliea sp. E1-2-M8 TaxID=3064706 RepID=UPI0027163006|nr:gephyrin-like molybdotransferase Glp [Haliea sp. E1-2-M8]MDO8860636.1 molybdopterin molybdotransferase MoeA [Haliea sp. E1-2-M8]